MDISTQQSSQTDEPTVLVKKADGTMQRVAVSTLGFVSQPPAATATVQDERIVAPSEPIADRAQSSAIEPDEMPVPIVASQSIKVADHSNGEEIFNEALVAKAKKMERNKPVKIDDEKQKIQFAVEDEPVPAPVKKLYTFVMEEQPPVLSVAVPMVLQPQQLSTTAPVADYFVDKAAADISVPKIRESTESFGSSPIVSEPREEKNEQGMETTQNILVQSSNNGENKVQWERDDHASPLDDSFDEVEGAHLPISGETDARVERVLSSLSLSLSNTQKQRLRPIVLSLIKDVRTPDQAREYLVRDEAGGGIGLTDMDAATVLDRVKNTQQKSAPAKVPVVTSQQIKTSVPMDGGAMPGIVGGVMPSGGRQQMSTKPVMHDVVAAAVVAGSVAQNQTVGPVDELRTMTLEAARRLGSGATAMTQEIKERLDNLKNESYLLYLQGKNAWLQSPLYSEYRDIAVQALSSHQSLTAVLSAGGKNGLSMEEYTQIVMLNRGL